MTIQSPPTLGDLDVRWCSTAEELASAAKISYLNQDAFSNPLRAALATLNGKSVGAFWVATEYFDEHELGVRIVLNQDQAWLFAAMVDKEKRGLGIYSKILQFVTSELGEQGIEDLLVAVNPYNKPSDHIHKKHSDRTAGLVTAIRFLKVAWCFTSGSLKARSRFTSNSLDKPIEFSTIK